MDYLTCNNNNQFCTSVNNYKISIITLIIIVILFIIIYGVLVRNVFKKDILEYKFADCTGCDYWAGTHFLFFAGLAYLFPNKLMWIMIIGIIWEFIETFLGTHDLKFFGRRLMLIGNTDDNGNVKSSEDDESWWYGRVTDIAFNLMGVISGYTLSIYTQRTNIFVNI